MCLLLLNRLMCEINKFLFQTFFTLLTWILIHSLVWDGELTRDEDLFFPLNILADVLKGAEIASFNVEYNTVIKDKKEPLSIDKSNLKFTNSMEKTGIRGNSLAEISVNNLINFLVNPNNAMTSLEFSYYLVSKVFPILK